MGDPKEFVPTKADLLAAEGIKAHLAGEANVARMHYTAALLLNPDHPVALWNLSGILMSCGQNHAAMSVAKRVVDVAPGARANYAATLMHLGKYPAARREVEAALQKMPNDAGVWHNYALMLYNMKNIPGALLAIEKSLSLGNAPPARISDQALFTLASGDIDLGLARYECRWNTLQKSHVWDRVEEAGISEWRGEDLNGKKLLIHHEQGFGDSIMLCRLIEKLEIKYPSCSVTVAVPPPLARLFEVNLDCGCVVINWDDVLSEPGEFDLHVPMLSVLRYLGKEAIPSEPYLSAEPWYVGPTHGFKVGICWESGYHGPVLERRRRKVSLELLFPLSEIPGVRLISLQKDNAAHDIVNLGAEGFITDPMARVEDFYDTARIIAGLDCVVSVDSAVAHLAGAMGKPVMMLGPYVRCWRWWGNTAGKPWYDNFRIFPQTTPNSWTEAVKFTIRAVERMAKGAGEKKNAP